MLLCAPKQLSKCFLFCSRIVSPDLLLAHTPHSRSGDQHAPSFFLGRADRQVEVIDIFESCVFAADAVEFVLMTPPCASQAAYVLGLRSCTQRSECKFSIHSLACASKVKNRLMHNNSTPITTHQSTHFIVQCTLSALYVYVPTRVHIDMLSCLCLSIV